MFLRKVRIANHVAFSVGFIGTTIGIATYLRHESIWQDSKRRLFEFRYKIPFSTKEPMILQQKPEYVPEFLFNIKEMIRLQIENARPAQKTVWTIMGINCLVFAAWRIPSLHSFMSRHFIHTPALNRPYTLLTCVFSHQSPLHLIFNMMALNSFMPFLQESKGLSTEQIVAFYLSAGILSSLGSHVFSAFNASRAVIGGLGASGAIWAFLTAYVILM
jgi:membrane associated rhomboid family serine protease